mmetsp:Transcript_4367/g.8449  ORF Transcript_4367/g.8449 Transcript_4367/m.8449 type:complete len:202 (+) Transcript_4367:121-726(+)
MLSCSSPACPPCRACLRQTCPRACCRCSRSWRKGKESISRRRRAGSASSPSGVPLRSTLWPASRRAPCSSLTKAKPSSHSTSHGPEPQTDASALHGTWLLLDGVYSGWCGQPDVFGLKHATRPLFGNRRGRTAASRIRKERLSLVPQTREQPAPSVAPRIKHTFSRVLARRGAQVCVSRGSACVRTKERHRDSRPCQETQM